MKIYAELYGDIQKLRIKSRSGNNPGSCSMISSNLTTCGKEGTIIPISRLMAEKVDTYNKAIERITRQVGGDRLYRVNSVDISPRRH